MTFTLSKFIINSMNTAIAHLLYIVAATVLGAIAGSLIGLLLTAINNHILHHWINAAIGNYWWWAKYFAVAGGGLGLLGSIAWRVHLALK